MNSNPAAVETDFTLNFNSSVAAADPASPSASSASGTTGIASIMGWRDALLDPYAVVVPQQTNKQKREAVAALLKADPGRSNNATAKIAKVNDKTVASVRAELEHRSEIPNAETRTDTEGRQQLAKKPARRSSPNGGAGRGDRHGEGGRRHDGSSRRHDDRGHDHGDARGDNGGHGHGAEQAGAQGDVGAVDLSRLHGRIEELEAEKWQRDMKIRLRDIKIAKLESEIEKMRAALQAPKPITTLALATLTLPKFLEIMPPAWRPELMARARTGKSVAGAAEPFSRPAKSSAGRSPWFRPPARPRTSRPWSPLPMKRRRSRRCGSSASCSPASASMRSRSYRSTRRRSAVPTGNM